MADAIRTSEKDKPTTVIRGYGEGKSRPTKPRVNQGSGKPLGHEMTGTWEGKPTKTHCGKSKGNQVLPTMQQG